MNELFKNYSDELLNEHRLTLIKKPARNMENFSAVVKDLLARISQLQYPQIQSWIFACKIMFFCDCAKLAQAPQKKRTADWQSV